MSYVKTVWANGDIITAAKLNNMESGIEAANAPEAVPTLTITWTNGGDTLTIPKAEIDYIASNCPSKIKQIDIEEGSDPVIGYSSLAGSGPDSVIYTRVESSDPASQTITLCVALSITSSDVYFEGDLLTLSGDNYVYNAN